MLVPVCVDAAANEWSLVEFQGELVGEDSLAGVEVGSLRFPAGGGAPTLRVGNHILTGKVAPLAKPFAVLHKQAARADEHTEGESVARVYMYGWLAGCG
jgi:hypothetical protein